jgi:hypothetical protein
VLLVKCLELQLLLVKQADMARLAAFVKRLTTLLLLVSKVEWDGDQGQAAAGVGGWVGGNGA